MERKIDVSAMEEFETRMVKVRIEVSLWENRKSVSTRGVIIEVNPDDLPTLSWGDTFPKGKFVMVDSTNREQS
jgi:hypothetical protein